MLWKNRYDCLQCDEDKLRNVFLALFNRTLIIDDVKIFSLTMDSITDKSVTRKILRKCIKTECLIVILNFWQLCWAFTFYTEIEAILVQMVFFNSPCFILLFYSSSLKMFRYMTKFNFLVSQSMHQNW